MKLNHDCSFIMNRWRGKVAVVTGASAGIGAAVCEKLVNEGLQVAGLARRVERVEELSKKLNGISGKLYPIKCDVQKKKEIINAFKWIFDNIGPVQILINNAGILRAGTIIESDSDEWSQILNTNVLALAICTQEAVKQMRPSDLPGHIININSIAGHIPYSGNPPLVNMYTPSKYAVTALTTITKKELIHFKTRIKITSVSPGVVDTEIFAIANMPIKVSERPHLKCSELADCIAYILSTPSNVHINEFHVTAANEILE